MLACEGSGDQEGGHARRFGNGCIGGLVNRLAELNFYQPWTIYKWNSLLLFSPSLHYRSHAHPVRVLLACSSLSSYKGLPDLRYVWRVSGGRFLAADRLRGMGFRSAAVLCYNSMKKRYGD